jgi:hypothetical protein
LWKNVLNGVIPETLPKWEERWLHALRELIRREVGYIEGNAHVPEEDFEEAKRLLRLWKKKAPALDLGDVLKLIDRELARRRTGRHDLDEKLPST